LMHSLTRIALVISDSISFVFAESLASVSFILSWFNLKFFAQISHKHLLFFLQEDALQHHLIGIE